MCMTFVNLRHVFFDIVRKHVHMSKAVDGQDWEIVQGLPQVVQGVSELWPIRSQEVDAICGNKIKKN